MNALEVRFTSSPDQPPRLVGTLAAQRGQVFFEYSEAWLKGGLNLSPFRLPFQPGLFEHRDRAFGPLPGLFADALPDAWGLLLMDRHFHGLRMDPAALGPLERLAWLGTRTMGALTYHPPSGPEGSLEAPFDLGEVARQALDLLAGRTTEVLPQLLRAGGSPGGARPKVLVGYHPVEDAVRSGEVDLPEGFEPWLVKFPAREDGPGAGATEYAYSLMARTAGIDLPETRLFRAADGGRYFGIRRFDRERNRRLHFHSFGNLIQADFRIPSCDYADLLKATALLTRDHGEVLEAFRRMVFNVFAHNRDDHAKNFAFLLDDRSGLWSLTPAYDLTFSPGPGGEHTMTLAGEGRNPGPPQILELARERDVSRAEADEILDAVRSAVARWPSFARQAGVSRAAAREIGSVIKP
ncbi:MAG: type II toxin-antitoxin system HipA family toxin [Holophaga sp.]